MKTTSYYRNLIARTLSIPADESRLVEAYLRSQHGTLNALSLNDIRDAYIGAIRELIEADRQFAHQLAETMGI